jgi:hypothetical protein
MAIVAVQPHLFEIQVFSINFNMNADNIKNERISFFLL